MTRGNILRFVSIQWSAWLTTKDKVRYYDFREYLKAEFGFTCGGSLTDFQYVITDDKKFAWFILSYKI